MKSVVAYHDLLSLIHLVVTFHWSLVKFNYLSQFILFSFLRAENYWSFKQVGDVEICQRRCSWSGVFRHLGHEAWHLVQSWLNRPFVRMWDCACPALAHLLKITSLIELESTMLLGFKQLRRLIQASWGRTTLFANAHCLLHLTLLRANVQRTLICWRSHEIQEWFIDHAGACLLNLIRPCIQVSGHGFLSQRVQV